MEPSFGKPAPAGEEAIDQLRSLLAISNQIHSGGEASRTFQLIAEEAARLLLAEHAALFVLRADGSLEVQAAWNLSEAYTIEVGRHYAGSAGGLAGKLGRPLVILDVQMDPRVSPALRTAAAREGFAAQMILPLSQAGTLYGGLVLYWNEADLPARADLSIAQLFADQATVALLNAQALAAARKRGDVAEQLAAQRLSEVQAANRGLSAALDELMQLERLKGDFLGAVSHELRTPLTTILGFAEFLEEGIAGELTGEQRRMLNQIIDATMHLASLVDDLLDFARLESGRFKLDPRPMPLGPLLEDVMASQASVAANSEVELATDIAAMPHVLADPSRVRQICLNLVSNAIKFTRPGGKVMVRARATPEYVRVEVIDTGVGIASDDQKNLFRKFFRVDNSLTRTTKGTGLGLAIAKQLVEAQGGSITVHSKPDEGSTFSFTLPNAQGG